MTKHALWAALALLACDAEADPSSDGGAGERVTVSCTSVVTLTGEGDRSFCTEYPGLSTFQVLGVQSACEASSIDGGIGLRSTFTRAPCSRAGAPGGCSQVLRGQTVITWHYEESSPGAWRGACERDGGTWIEP